MQETEVVIGSVVAKEGGGTETVTEIGGFDDEKGWQAYLEQYLPPGFLDTCEGEEIASRVGYWLRGRFVFNAAVRLFCVMSGDSDPFSAEIDETHIVEDLKEKIKTERGITVNAVALTLCEIKIDVSNDNDYTRIMNSISQGDYDFANKQKLNVTREISMFFTRDSNKTIEVLVELPPGEPIDSRACGNVVPMARVRQLDAPFHSRTPRHTQSVDQSSLKTRKSLPI